MRPLSRDGHFDTGKNPAAYAVAPSLLRPGNESLQRLPIYCPL